MYGNMYGKHGVYIDDIGDLDLVGGIPTPLKHMSLSVGMMTFTI